MSFIIGILVFVFSVCLAIALHEFGHFYFAKKFGVYVSEFMIGFGRQIVSKRVGETTYGLKMVLLGGYVKILGMFYPGSDGRKIYNSKGEYTLVESSRRESVSQIPVGHEHRAFYLLSVPKKVVVLLAGPLMNLFLCVLCVFIVTMGIGIKQPSMVLGEVPKCFSVETVGVSSSGSKNPSVSSSTSSNSSGQGCENVTPAYSVGVRKGDKILAVNGKSVSSWNEFLVEVSKIKTDSLVVLSVERDLKVLDFSVSPVKVDGAYKFGVVPSFERSRLGFVDSLSFVQKMGVETFAIIFRLPVAVYDVGMDWFSGQERSDNSIASIVGIAKVSGDIASSDIGFVDKIVSNLMLFASLNMGLFIFNLLPVTPLDGGHIVTALWEGVKRFYLRRFCGVKTYYVDNARMLPFTYVIVGLLLAMTVFLVLADIFNPIQI